MNETDELTQAEVKTNGHAKAPIEVLRAPKASGKQRRWLIIAGVALVAAIAAAVPTVRSAYSHESTDDAFVDGHIITIAPKVSGQVLAVHVTDNQAVKAGDLLAEIDPRDYEAKVAEERGKVAAVEAESRRAVADAKRYETLYKEDGVSQQQLDDARATAASALAQVAKERGALQQDELNLSYTKLMAPETGRVTRKALEAGSYVSVGQSLLSIVPDRVWVTANFKETQLAHMRAGQRVTLKVDAYPDRVFEGHVDSIQSGTGERFSLLPPENATGNYVKVVQRIPVKILIDGEQDPDRRLAPGMSVVPSVLVR